MVKGTRQADPFRETENDPPMSNLKSINGLSAASKFKRNKKKGPKDIKIRTKQNADSAAQRENGVPVISSVVQNVERAQNVQKKKKKRKMGSPIIIEDTEGEHPAIPLPVTLSQSIVIESEVAAVSLGPFRVSKKKKRDKKTQITVAECINPSFDKSSVRNTAFNFTDSPLEKPAEQIVDISKKTRESRSQEVTEYSVEHAEPLGANFSSDNFEDSEEKIVAENTVVKNIEEIDEKLSPRFYSFTNKVLAIIEPDCKFCFHGKLRVRVLYGAVRIYGVSLNSEKTRTPVTIYSPRVYSPVAIEATESEIDDRDITRVWESMGEQCTDRKLAKRLQSDISSVDDGWAIVELKNFDNELTSFLANHCPFRLFPRVEDPSNHSWRDARRAEIVLQANLRFVDACKQLTIGSRGIDDLADGICYDWETKNASRTIIAGGKGVGKSTTARYLVNKLLDKSNAVVFIDLDPGQAEFTPAGCISLTVVEEPLLGPNFTHLKTPHYQLYLGSVDVTRCFTHYIDGVRKLVDRIGEDKRLMALPIVVNTMGFCKGIGWDIMSYVIKVLSPTDVIQILSRRSKNNFGDTLSRQVIDRQTLGWMNWTKETMNINKPTRHQLHVIFSEAETGSGTAESWNLEPHQQRDLVMLAYLSQIVGNHKSATASLQSRTSGPSINAVPPYTIPFAAMCVSLAGAFVPQVLSVMNGNIVALCGVDLELTEESNSEDKIAAGYPRVLIRQPLSTCYGFGILRGVDMEKELLFLNTPLSVAHLEHVNCLVGCVNVPNSLVQMNQHGAPYTGSEYNLPTSRQPRRGYFRTRYQDT